jgi:hypothetical protein
MGETFEGYNASVELAGDALVLRRRGAAAAVRGLSAEPRSVPLAAVTEIEFRDATRFNNGWLRIGLEGEPLEGAGHPDPYDPHTVLFLHRSRTEFQRLRDHLAAAVERNHAGR